VRLETQGQPSPILTVAKVGASADNEPSLSANLSRNDQEFVIGSEGVAARDLLAKFKATPGKIGVSYEFDKNDPAADFRDHAASLRGEPDDTNPHSIIVDVGRNAPRRPEPYTVILEFPSADLQGLLQPGYAIPANKMFVSAAEEINLAPPSTERAKTEFFFEATFTSIVDAASRERSNVGLFGVHLKPTLPMLTGNVFDRSDSPWWIAFRPLFDADVDTQPIKDSQAPNRVVFGMDFELGRDAGIENASSFLQQIVWLNGIRYDSDRDFKLKTLYWRTELVPYYIKFEQTREQRLRQFRFPGGIRQADRGRRFPVVSSYKLQPSVGYQLGGIIAGEERATRLPTDRISRLFVKLSAAAEFRRLLQISLDDTYYFLENAPRRRNRNYLEARLDFNTGSLFNVDLGALQSAITLKFQRGDLPPAFSPVNSLSMGVRLYK
jgi:hypothetical protein